MLRNYLIIHGAEGHPGENWLPWICEHLTRLGKTVAVPSFPTPEHQTRSSWMAIALQAMNGWNADETTIIGHSSGALLALRLSEEAARPYALVVAVCPFSRPLGHILYDNLNASFLEPPFDWKAVKQGARRQIFFAGDNDPYVPLADAREVANKVGGQLHIVPGGGHLNAAAGFTSFAALANVLT